ncbi:MAG: hypothetical protein SOR40_07660 [Rothia sp. (in: high G+C Gram-positive bacteria)]|nr:hypothetical protein [Rothia sp. (in: high G+C Gram-positive bacteria)]
MSEQFESPQFHQPTSSSDREFTYMAIGMVAGAVPGIALGLLLSLWAGHAALWVSVTGGIGIVLGLLVSRLLYSRSLKAQKEDRA